MGTIASRVAKRYLNLMAAETSDEEESQEEESAEGSFGGKGPFVLPDDHKAGMRVPKGGACCANCFYASEEDGKPACNEPNFAVWNGGDRLLPAPADEYCSDFWKPSEDREEEISEQEPYETV